MTDSRKILARDRKHRLYRARAGEPVDKPREPNHRSQSQRRHGGRQRALGPASSVKPGPAPGEVGWDHDATVSEPIRELQEHRASVSAQILALLSDPSVEAITTTAAVSALGLPRSDVSTAIATLVQSGVLIERGDVTNRSYMVAPARKHQLESLFRDTAQELGETALMVSPQQVDAQLMALQDDVPRLPVTAGLLSLFLPGTGQLLNGDIARASLIFAVWSLAFLMQFLPIWFFVSMYAGAEAFFTAKLRGMERELANEADAAGGKPEPRPT